MSKCFLHFIIIISMLSDLLSVKLCSVLGIKEGIRAAAMRQGGLFCSTRIFTIGRLDPLIGKVSDPRGRRVEIGGSKKLQ